MVSVPGMPHTRPATLISTQHCPCSTSDRANTRIEPGLYYPEREIGVRQRADADGRAEREHVADHQQDRGRQ